MSEEQTPYKGSISAFGVPPQDEHPGKNVGSVVGIVIIIIVLAFGGFYFWGKRLSEESSLAPDATGLRGEESLFVPAPGSTVDETIVGDEENNTN